MSSAASSPSSAPLSSPTKPSTRSGVIEHQGIDIVPEHERTAKPRDLFWPWFAANISVFGMSYGTWILGFGISFWQAVVVNVIGVVVSFLLCGLIAIAGKRGSAPTMVLSRAAFGVNGQKLPGIISWFTSIGWETWLAILAVLATATVFKALGLPGGTGIKLVAAAVVAAMIVLASVLGYHMIMKLQSILTWATGLMTIVFVLLVLPKVNWNAVMALPSGNIQQCIGALIMVMTGFGLGWINIAADWSRYQKRTASDGSIVLWNTIGGALAPVFLVVVGLLLAGSDEQLREAISSDPVGALATLLPTWALIPFWIAAVLSLISGAVLGIYSSGLTLLSLGIKIPRPAAAAIDGIILTLGTIYVVFFAPNFAEPFQSFLITLGVPLAAWAGILIADILTRRRDYDEAALFDPRGRYGCVDWISISTFLVSSALGWGLVVNTFTTEASWNNWQGYLFAPLGLGHFNATEGYWEGNWAYSNLGVLLALVFGFAVTFFARNARIRRQEAEA